MDHELHNHAMGRTGALILAENVIKHNGGHHQSGNKWFYVMNVTVRSTGTLDVIVTDVYLNGTRVTFNSTACAGSVRSGQWGMRDSLGNYGETIISPGLTGTVFFNATLTKGQMCIIGLFCSGSIF